MATKRRRLTRAEQQAQTRARLLDAAVRVCGRRGLQDASLEQISEAAGYTAGAIYSNFKSKEDLLLAVFEERVEPRLAEATEAMISAPGAREQADALGVLVNNLLTDDRTYLTLLIEFWGLAARNKAVGRRFAEVRRRRREQVADRIRARLALQDGAADVDADELAAQFVAATIGVLLESVVDPQLDADRLQSQIFTAIARTGTTPARAR